MFREELTAKLSIPPKEVYRFHALLTRIPVVLFAELQKLILKLMESQGTPNSQNKFEKK